MKRAGKTLLIGAVVTALGVAGTVYAYAGGWTVEGQVKYSAKVEKMPRGVEPSVARQSHLAVVTWSAQEIAPGVAMDHYVVTAHSDNAPPQPDVTRTVVAADGPVESLTFTTAEVAGGKWRWTITPRFRNWTGAESPKSRRLTFPAAPAGSPAPPLALGDEIAPSPSPNTQKSPAAPGKTSPAAPKPGDSTPDEPRPPKAEDSSEPPATAPEPAPPGPAESAPVPTTPASSGPAAVAAG